MKTKFDSVILVAVKVHRVQELASCEKLATYIIIKLSAHSIQDSTHKILMDCGKFHMTCDVILSLSTGRNECQRCM